MKKLFLLLPFIAFLSTSCDNEEKIEVEKEIKFSFSAPTTNGASGGRTTALPEPTRLLVTINDGAGTTVADRRELTVYKFGDTFLSAPLTLKTTEGAAYALIEFFVLGSDNQVAYVTPKEGSDMAHLVADALDIQFAVSKDQITIVTPEVLALDDDADPEEFGYGQFGFKIIKTITAVFSSFIKGASNFELTESHVKIEGLSNTTNFEVLWTYEIDLAARANTIIMKEAPLYKITATKTGYANWFHSQAIQNHEAIEIIFEDNSLRFETIWNRHYGGSGGERIKKTIATSDGGALIIGSTSSNDHDVEVSRGETGSDVWVLKLNASGAIGWSKVYNEPFSDLPNSYSHAESASEFQDGSGYLITASSSIQGTTSGWLLKIDAQGNVVWIKPDHGYEFYSTQTAVSGYDNILMIGYRHDPPPYSNNVRKVVRQIDGAGNTVWEKLTFDETFAHGLQIERDANSYLITSFSGFICKMNAQGDVEWKKNLPQRLNPYKLIPSVVNKVTADGYMFFEMDDYKKVIHGKEEKIETIGVVKLNKNGDLVWKKNIDSPGKALAFVMDVATTASGNFLLVGGSTSNTASPYSKDAWIVEINQLGNGVGEKFLHGAGSSHLRQSSFSSIVSMGNEYVIAGTSLDKGRDIPGNYGAFDTWAMKIKF
jgi:hypothetical protein